MEGSKTVLAEEALRRFEALEATLESRLLEVAFWWDRAVKAETLLAAKNFGVPDVATVEEMEEGAASSSDSEAVEGPAEAAAPLIDSKEGRSPVTDSSDGEGYQSLNRRQRTKRGRPVSYSEDSTKAPILSAGPGQRRDPRRAAQPRTTQAEDRGSDNAKKKQDTPAAQQLDAEQKKKQATPATQQLDTE
ncbi:hypothetical protein YQE_00489, partial [Dendroctonus ponderosae]